MSRASLSNWEWWVSRLERGEPTQSVTPTRRFAYRPLCGRHGEYLPCGVCNLDSMPARWWFNEMRARRRQAGDELSMQYPAIRNLAWVNTLRALLEWVRRD